MCDRILGETHLPDVPSGGDRGVWGRLCHSFSVTRGRQLHLPARIDLAQEEAEHCICL